MNNNPEFLNEILTRDFKGMDINNDGEIDREEFKRYFNGKYHVSDEEVWNLLESFDEEDTNNDG